MRRRIVECVANFSEGRDQRVVDAIVETIGRGPRIAVLHQTADADHNRCVITFAGSPESVSSAAVRAVAAAAQLIDLRRHTGVHPRLGAADVVPFVPVEGITLAECAELAHRTGEEIWRTVGVPVYFYEAAARTPERVQLESVRRGGFEGLREAVRTDPSRRPDIGGPELHPSAGAVIVGARKFLIAWNVNLETADLTVARAIARKTRASSGGFRCVKALGLSLASRGQVQVSMNLTDYEQTPMHTVFDAIRGEAEMMGVAIAGTEIIGLLPRAALEGAAERYFSFENFSRGSVLEQRIEDLLPFGIEELLDEMSDTSRATGGGSAAALAGAMSSALGVLLCRLMKISPDVFEAHRAYFTGAIEADGRAFAALMRTPDPADSAVVEAAEIPLGIAERAAALEEDVRSILSDCPPRYVSDAETAAALARAARQGALSTAQANVAGMNGGAVRKRMEMRLRAIS
jgi:glutamate formiminotransferase